MTRFTTDYTGTCPYCQKIVHFTQRSIECENCNISYELYPIELSSFNDQVTFVSCDNCKKNVVAIFRPHLSKKKGWGEFKIDLTYPIISDLAIPLGVPQKIWIDYVEGKKCLSFDAPKGSVVLFRRATQSLMKELGADPTKKLWKQILELKNNGIITNNLYELATELRLWGNFGAHPDDDLLDDVSLSDAQEMEYLLMQLLTYTLIQSAEIKQIQASRKKKKKSK